MCELCDKVNKIAHKLAELTLNEVGISKGARRNEVDIDTKSVAVFALVKASVAVAAAMGMQPEGLVLAMHEEVGQQYPQIAHVFQEASRFADMMTRDNDKEDQSIGFLSGGPKHKHEIN